VTASTPIPARSVVFDRRRWYVVIRVTTPTGEVQEFVADAQIQGGDAVWFGTRADHDACLELM
jgi:hypothetical protein